MGALEFIEQTRKTLHFYNEHTQIEKEIEPKHKAFRVVTVTESRARMP